MGEFARGDRQHAAARSKIERALYPALAHHVEDDLQAARRRAVMAGAEGLPGIDLDGYLAGARRAAVMRAVHDEAPGAHGLQALERLGDPVDIGKNLALDLDAREIGGEQGGEAFVDLRLFRPEHVDGGFPDVVLLVDLHRGDGVALFLEGVAHQRKRRFRLLLGGADIEADFAHGPGSCCFRSA